MKKCIWCGKIKGVLEQKMLGHKGYSLYRCTKCNRHFVKA